VKRIYLDHAATTPLSEPVREAMLPWLSPDGFGNASTLYSEGRAAKHAIDEARETLTSYLGCRFAEVLFTGSGTEAANMAIIGSALSNQNPGRRKIFLSSVEHHCVLNTASILQRLGYEVTHIPVNCQAQIDLDWLKNNLSEEVLLVSIQHANNETGTIHPVEKISELVRAQGAFFHVDAVQALGKTSIRYPDWADMATFSAHKIRGPKGIGAIYLKAGVKPSPILVGGGQEREMRAGTENVAAIAGFGAAVKHLQPVPEGLVEAFFAAIGSDFVPTITGDIPKLPTHAHMRFVDVSAETLIIRLDRSGVSASGGSACSSGSIEPSHVLVAMGWDRKAISEGIRFTFGSASTLEDAQEGGKRVGEAVRAILEVGKR
jgi:cysteine desulfurase